MTTTTQPQTPLMDPVQSLSVSIAAGLHFQLTREIARMSGARSAYRSRRFFLQQFEHFGHPANLAAHDRFRREERAAQRVMASNARYFLRILRAAQAGDPILPGTNRPLSESLR